MNKYKALIKFVWDQLKTQGFQKKGDTFFLSKNSNWGILNFQKSRSSSSDKVSFTINIGVSSTALRRVVDREDITTNPAIENCHWRKRIGFLLPSNQDFWWQIDNNTSLEHISNEIVTVLNTLAVPQIEEHISDESLEGYWTSGIAEGITELQRYIYLTTLLKLNGKENLPLVVEEFKKKSKGKSYENAAREHIIELENYVR